MLLACLVVAGPAWADGKRDLEDGIAFYENLDSERAKPRLEAASVATDLSSRDRARAHLYLGLLHFELGRTDEATRAVGTALGLDPKVAIPDGTSPKTIEFVRSIPARASEAPPPPPVVAGPPPAPPPAPPTLAPPTQALVASPLPPPEDEDGSPWLIVGIVGGALAVGVVVLAIVLAAGGDTAAETECATGGGGCLEVTFR